MSGVGSYVYFYSSSLKSKFSFWLRARWRFLLLATSILLTIYSLLLAPERLKQWTTAPSLVLSAVSVFLGIQQLRKEWGYSLENRLLEDDLISRLRPTGWEILRDLRRVAIFSSAVNHALSSSRISYRLVDKSYELPEKVSPYCQVILNKRKLGIISNEPKVGQKTDIDEVLLLSDHSIQLYETDYYKSIFTNDMALFDLVTPRSVPSRSETTLSGRSFFVNDRGSLARLSDERASNHIGVSTIAVFDDLEIPLVVQSRRSLQSTGQIAPSGSGSADFDRVRLSHGGVFTELVASEMERELREELGLSSSITCQSLVVGYCRILDRAGKPEYFGLTRVSSPVSVVRRTLFERLFTQRHVLLDEVVDVLLSPADVSDQLLAKLSALSEASSARDISIITRLNAKFAADFIKRSPASAKIFTG